MPAEAAEAAKEALCGRGIICDVSDRMLKRTLEEVGKQYKVTRERIRQIEAKALRKMRHPTRIRQLQGFLESEPVT